MAKNKYFLIFIKFLNFISRRFRFIAFIIIILFSFYMLMLSLRVSSALGYIPTSEDINKKIAVVQIQKSLITKIEKLIYIRQKNAYDQAFEHNPFLPYPETPIVSPSPSSGTIIPTGSPIASPNNSASNIIISPQP